MARRADIRAALLALVLGMLAAGPAAAHSAEDHNAAKPGTSPEAAPDEKRAVRLEPLPDLTLVDRSGQELRFVSEVLGEHIVVMDFIYTSCTTACPVLTAILKQVKERLGDRVGADVAMVSLTVDPVTDTPERLGRYAQEHGVGERWRFLTGPKDQVDRLLDELGAYTPDFEDHPVSIMVGDARRNVWYRFFGFTSPSKLLEAVDKLTQARDRAQTAAAARQEG